MFRTLEVPILGIVENMSYLDLPDGTRMDLFGSGGGEQLTSHEATSSARSSTRMCASRRQRQTHFGLSRVAGGKFPARNLKEDRGSGKCCSIKYEERAADQYCGISFRD
jgi:hypothetical protein